MKTQEASRCVDVQPHLIRIAACQRLASHGFLSAIRKQLEPIPFRERVQERKMTSTMTNHSENITTHAAGIDATSLDQLLLLATAASAATSAVNAPSLVVDHMTSLPPKTASPAHEATVERTTSEAKNAVVDKPALALKPSKVRHPPPQLIPSFRHPVYPPPPPPPSMMMLVSVPMMMMPPPPFGPQFPYRHAPQPMALHPYRRGSTPLGPYSQAVAKLRNKPVVAPTAIAKAARATTQQPAGITTNVRTNENLAVAQPSAGTGALSATLMDAAAPSFTEAAAFGATTVSQAKAQHSIGKSAVVVAAKIAAPPLQPLGQPHPATTSAVTVSQPWAPQEDFWLQNTVVTFGATSWGFNVASTQMQRRRSPGECETRWRLLCTRPTTDRKLGLPLPKIVGVKRKSTKRAGKITWTPEEDAVISKFVIDDNKGRPCQWSKLAKLLPGRHGKHCRNRWHLHLAPDIKKGDWTLDEDQLILSTIASRGFRWSEMAKMLPGRYVAGRDLKSFRL